MKRVFHHPPRPTRPTIWRSLAELENSPGFEVVLRREFPRGADVYEDSGLTKRDFMKLLGASMALAGVGVTGCRRPEAYVVPFNKGVEWTIPGKFLFYATAMPLRQGAMPLIVSTVDGRPTKIEGNPLHPFSNGGTDAFAQASILDLYDPNRSKAIKENGVEARPEALDNLLKAVSTSAEGMAFLVERKNSPTRDRLRAELEAKFPGMLWCEYEPLGTTWAQEAVAGAFGQGVRLLPNFQEADVIVALDSEFLNQSDKGVGFAHGFFARRSPDQKGAAMNRLYVVENHYTGTGGLADHRYRCKASLIGEFTRQLASHLSASTGDAGLTSMVEASPRTDATFDEAWLSACANDLLANRGRSIVFVGEQQPVWVQILGHAINQALGNIGATIMGVATDEKPSASISDLEAAIESGSVKTLFVLGGNPAYNAPSNLNFSESSRKGSAVSAARLVRGRDIEALSVARSCCALSRDVERRSRLRRHVLGGAADDTASVEWCQRIGDSRASWPDDRNRKAPRSSRKLLPRRLMPIRKGGTRSFGLALLRVANGRRRPFHFRGVRRRRQ